MYINYNERGKKQMKKVILMVSFLLVACMLLAKPMNFSQPVIATTFPVNVNLSGSGTVTTYDGIQALLESAKKTIDIEPFYINNKAGTAFDTQIIQTIIQKANEGVKVRILVDKNMEKYYQDSLTPLMNNKNIEVRQSTYYDSGNGVLHSKVVLVDGKSFYIGSICFDWVAFTYNHELGIIYTDKAVGSQIQTAFNFDWDNYNKPFKAVTTKQKGLTNAPYQLVMTPANSQGLQDAQTALFQLINGAKTSIDIEVMNITSMEPYQNNAVWPGFQEALIAAAKRGVKVRLLVSNWEFDSPTMMADGKAFLTAMQQASPNVSIKITNFPPTDPFVNYAYVDHAKDIIVDGKTVWFGNANLTWNYFNACRNFNLVVKNNPRVTQVVQNLYNTVWNSQYSVNYTGQEPALINAK